MGVVAFDQEGAAYWRDDVGNTYPVEQDADNDYIVRDQDGGVYVLPADEVDAALAESPQWSPDALDRLDRIEQGVAQWFEPQPDPAELAAQAAAIEGEYEAQLRAEQDVEWTTALAENINQAEHRLGKTLSAEEREAVYKDAAKTGGLDVTTPLENYWDDRSTSDGRRKLAKEAAEESMAAAQEQDAEDAEFEESLGPDPVRDMEPREGLKAAVEASQDNSEIEDAIGE